MISILIPTINRPEFIIRLLNYYHKVKCPYWLLIADSSDESRFSQTARRVTELKNHLKIRHVHCSNETFGFSLGKLVNMVETPYAVYTADDDFLVPNGLEVCADFLGHNFTYSSAHGYSILFNLNCSGPYGEIQGVSRYCQGSLENDLASHRLESYANNYFVNIFSLQRTENWKKIAAVMPNIPEKSFAGEIYPCFMSIVQGKVKELDCFYLVRQGHDRRYSLLSSYDWVLDPAWNPSYQIIYKELYQEIMKQDHQPLSEAQSFVKKVLWSYIMKGLELSKGPCGFEQIKINVKNILQKNELVFNLAKRTKNLISPSIELDLKWLLKQYKEDFKPIYQAVCSK